MAEAQAIFSMCMQALIGFATIGKILYEIYTNKKPPEK
jgi:hypothetical protein